MVGLSITLLMSFVLGLKSLTFLEINYSLILFNMLNVYLSYYGDI